MTALLVLIIVAILMVVIVALCAAGTIPMNVGIGIRLPATRLSDEAWRAGHKAAFLPCLIGAAIAIGIAGFGVVIEDFTSAATAIVTAVLIATLGIAAVFAHRGAMRTVHSR